MIAWSLSGGGSRGPLQVGALRALFEAGIQPDLLVGTSAGGLNAAFLATDPSPAGVEHLAQIWLSARRQDILPEGTLGRAIRFLRGADSLNSNAALRNYILKHVPSGMRVFGDLKIRLYLATADLQTGQLFLYGDDPSANLIEAAVASASLPIVWPPLEISKHQYVDGGVVANVPISIALDKGAKTVYVLDLEPFEISPVIHGVYRIALRAFSVLIHQQLLRDLDNAIRFSRATLHHIYMGDLWSDLPLEDFSHTEELIEAGYRRAKQYLDHPMPNQLALPAAQLMTAPAICPPGAVPYNLR